MALWRAHKLGWAGARSSSDGLLKGSFKDAAAKITMLEFGLDADNGGHNAILHRQLLAIDPLHWQELMEVGLGNVYRTDMSADHDTDKVS